DHREIAVAVPILRVGGPRRDHAFGIAEPRGFVDLDGERDVVGCALGLQRVEQRKLAALVARVESSPYRALLRFEQAKERALLPILVRLRIGFAGVELLGRAGLTLPQHAAGVE